MRAATVASVTNDDRTGAAMVVDHLFELGHSRIAHIDGGSEAGAQPRRAGYERAMQGHGLETEIQTVSGGFTEEDGRVGMRRLLVGGTWPTAVFAANDLAAFGALEVLDAEGIDVPGVISVVGYDNTALATNHRLGLTTVDQPRHDMGRMAAELILAAIASAGTAVNHAVLTPKLIVRGSTGPPSP